MVRGPGEAGKLSVWEHRKFCAAGRRIYVPDWQTQVLHERWDGRKHRQGNIRGGCGEGFIYLHRGRCQHTAESLPCGSCLQINPYHGVNYLATSGIPTGILSTAIPTSPCIAVMICAYLGRYIHTYMACRSRAYLGATKYIVVDTLRGWPGARHAGHRSRIPWQETIQLCLLDVCWTVPGRACEPCAGWITWDGRSATSGRSPGL